MRSIIISIILVFLLTSSAGAKPDEFKELGVKGYDLVWDMKFDEANKVFDEMIRMKPENALGYLLKSKSYILMHYYGTDDEEHFKKYEEYSFKALDIAEEMLEKNKNDVDALCYLGGAYGYLGFFYVEKGKYFSGVRYGRKGVHYLKKTIEKDSAYYDAFLGLGLYHYLIGSLPKGISSVASIMLGLDADMKKGLDEMQLATSKGNYIKDEAKFMLASQIYMGNEHNPEAASELFEELITKYPENKYFPYYLSICYRRQNKHNLSVRVLNNALNSKTVNDYPFAYGRLYFDLGRAYFEMNDFDKAISAYNNAVKMFLYKGGEKTWVYAWSLFNIGDSYEMKGQPDKALEYYKKIKKKSKKNAYETAQTRITNPRTPASISYTKATNYYRCNNYTQGDSMLSEYIKLTHKVDSSDNSFPAHLYYYRGIIELDLQKFQKSIQTFHKVFEMNSVEAEWIKPWSHYYLGNCYREIREFEKAKQEYEAAYNYKDKKLRSNINKALEEME